MAARLVFPDDVRPDFTGFGPGAFGFLRGLAGNNDRAWFTPRKDDYQAEIRFPMECLVAEFRPGGAGDGLIVRGDPTRSMFRIHRDVRFSKDKSPYKTHAGAVLSRTGKRGEPGIVYIHIEPGNCFVSAGFWRPDPALLAAWRARMADQPREWLAIVEPYAEAGGEVFMRTIAALKTMPRGFRDHADTAVAEYLKWKSFLMTRKLSDGDAGDRGLIAIVRDLALKAAPLLDYGWQIVDRPAAFDPRRHLR